MSGNTEGIQLEQGTYELIRNRLHQQGTDLNHRLEKLNIARKEVFGSIDTRLLATERITTDNNCNPADIARYGDLFLFGYNVHFGLRTEVHVSDVFSIYYYKDHSFSRKEIGTLEDKSFIEDFRNLYKYYRDTRFARFYVKGPYVYMIFQTGKSVKDIKAFKWLIKEDGLTYVDNRSDHEVNFPEQYEFRWKRTTRDNFRHGRHPHISVEDRVFVETIGGDLTIKIEDNTGTGQGIYSEEVAHKDQTLDDAEIHYGIVGNIIALKIKPYKEEAYRYIIYNEKTREALRADSLADSCILLPDGQGIIFANGYYLQRGEHKFFERQLDEMVFERRLASPNGEDFVYVFFNQQEGLYLLLFYNIIEQTVGVPLICHGYSIFDNGELLFFKAEQEPQKHHTIFIWQTPFVSPNYPLSTASNNYLFKIGNKELVRAMAECRELISLLHKDDSYMNLYIDLVRKSVETIDTYHWLDKEETYKLLEPLSHIKDSAASAIDEYEKVSRIRKNTAEQIAKVQQQIQDLISKVRKSSFRHINDFVTLLAAFRSCRGDVVSLKELRYADAEAIASFETQLSEQSSQLSASCVSFLLKKEALQPYDEKVEHIRKSTASAIKMTEANALDEEAGKLAAELEMLIEIVSNLKIEDATETTRIIDDISAIYASFNQVKAGIKKKKKALASKEGKAEFNAQLKLVDQSVINYLDVCDSPEKCDEYLNKLIVQLEELEGRFAEFDEYADIILQKREEIYNAFESRRLQLTESRNRKATNLMRSAGRILNGIQHKAASLHTNQEINGYFASDLMVEKVRDIINSLAKLGDPIKADDIQSRLKTIKEDTLRQLRDKKELFSESDDLIKFGKHQFSVNKQPLDLSIVQREDDIFYHLGGTSFFEKIKDENILSARDLWEQSLISENHEVYRAEYLAYSIYMGLLHDEAGLEALTLKAQAELQEYVRNYMQPLYNEGYIKGVHDHDASLILQALLNTGKHSGLLRYPSPSRACAALYWHIFADKETKEHFNHMLKGIGAILKVFPKTHQFDGMIAEVRLQLNTFNEKEKLFDEQELEDAAEYLFHELGLSDHFIIDSTAATLYNGFMEYLKKVGHYTAFEQYLRALKSQEASAYKLALQWVKAYTQHAGHNEKDDFIEEVATLIVCNSYDARYIRNASLRTTFKDMHGTHKLVNNGVYIFNYNHFMIRLRNYTAQTVPRYLAFSKFKKDSIEQFKEELRLEEYKPKVMSAFVRNRLIDNVYLPLVGNNLARQLGAAGNNKRTDRMGMLLLISPPGYGKTTLMEYIANRLGIVFMKINGPAIGHKVTSVDPAEAPNANAREELEKLNLSFEMGDNIMIYLDDIQHCNPEFLQKFISLCDAQRKIEGVYKGKSRTYDLRGKKVCVVMAGNPYTESGEKFRIPDMLANRADIYNLGDIIGDTAEDFKLSYIENCLTSNSILSKIATKSQKDIYPMIMLAQTGDREGMEFEAEYSNEEISESVAILKKLFRLRDIILRVNQEYIYSAGQADDYRTEPAFKLQGSYRDMNKIAEKILPLTNDKELNTIILSHYESESQTLTMGAEANMLKFLEMNGLITEEKARRWEEIKTTFRKNQKLRGAEGHTAQILLQMENISGGLEGIQKAIEKE